MRILFRHFHVQIVCSDRISRLGLSAITESHIQWNRMCFQAVKLYSGDRPIGLFAEKLPQNLEKLNQVYEEIADVLKVQGFRILKTPGRYISKAKFASLFRDFNSYLQGGKSATVSVGSIILSGER